MHAHTRFLKVYFQDPKKACICVCACLFMRIYIYIHIYIHTHTHIHTQGTNPCGYAMLYACADYIHCQHDSLCQIWESSSHTRTHVTICIHHTHDSFAQRPVLLPITYTHTPKHTHTYAQAHTHMRTHKDQSCCQAHTRIRSYMYTHMKKTESWCLYYQLNYFLHLTCAPQYIHALHPIVENRTHTAHLPHTDLILTYVHSTCLTRKNLQKKRNTQSFLTQN
jgi:hypothetical protein